MPTYRYRLVSKRKSRWDRGCGKIFEFDSIRAQRVSALSPAPSNSQARLWVSHAQVPVTPHIVTRVLPSDSGLTAQVHVILNQRCPIADANSSTGSYETRRIPAFSTGKTHDRARYVINVVKLSIVCYGHFLNVDFANQRSRRSLSANCA